VESGRLQTQGAHAGHGHFEFKIVEAETKKQLLCACEVCALLETKKQLLCACEVCALLETFCIIVTCAWCVGCVFCFLFGVCSA
jgi:hypothetical protein